MMPEQSVVVLEVKEYDYDFLASTNLHGQHPLKCVDDNKRYPKWLLRRAQEELRRNCDFYHIDWKSYRFAEISTTGVTWQVDFKDSEERNAAVISVYEIYYDSRNKRILQSCFSLG